MQAASKKVKITHSYICKINEKKTYSLLVQLVLKKTLLRLTQCYVSWSHYICEDFPVRSPVSDTLAVELKVMFAPVAAG